MTPHRGNTILFRSSQQLPRFCLGPSKGFLSWHGALLGPSTCLVRCIPNYRDTRTLSGVWQLTQTLIVRVLKTHVFTPNLDFEKSTEYNWVSDQTPERSCTHMWCRLVSPREPLSRFRCWLCKRKFRRLCDRRFSTLARDPPGFDGRSEGGHPEKVKSFGYSSDLLFRNNSRVMKCPSTSLGQAARGYGIWTSK